MKLIQGTFAKEGDPEFGISRGRLMPTHKVLDDTDVPADARQKLQDSLVLVHGGMAQNVGPILEMVTEKYLLRSGPEWIARQQTHGVLDKILSALHTGDIPAIGAATTENFRQPIQTIIPWASNLYTETLIEKVSAEFGKDFWGFWMLGGMSGGGMGFIFAPHRRAEAQARLLDHTAVLLGSAHGDDSVPGIGERELSDMPPEVRTTPAGSAAANASRISARCMPYMPFQPAESAVTILPTTEPSMRL